MCGLSAAYPLPADHESGGGCALTPRENVNNADRRVDGAGRVPWASYACPCSSKPAKDGECLTISFRGGEIRKCTKSEKAIRKGVRLI